MVEERLSCKIEPKMSCRILPFWLIVCHADLDSTLETPVSSRDLKKIFSKRGFCNEFLFWFASWLRVQPPQPFRGQPVKVWKVQPPDFPSDFEGFNQCLIQLCLLEKSTDVFVRAESTLDDLCWLLWIWMLLMFRIDVVPMHV